MLRGLEARLADVHEAAAGQQWDLSLTMAKHKPACQ